MSSASGLAGPAAPDFPVDLSRSRPVDRPSGMPTLLRIDSSLRTEGSHGRALADHAEDLWLRAHGGRVLRRDLARDPVPHLDAGGAILDIASLVKHAEDSALASFLDAEGAIASYRAAIKITPNYLCAHNNLGIVLASEGRSEEAIDAYQRVIARCPVSMGVGDAAAIEWKTDSGGPTLRE